MVRANDELRARNKYPFHIKVADQPTIYELQIGGDSYCGGRDWG